MLSCPAYIIWNANPEIFAIGSVSIRYYSLFYFFGLMSAYASIAWMFTREKISMDVFFKLYFFLLFGILFGARIIHCVFYEPQYYLAHPLEILLPFRIGGEKLIWTGYRGLASHGGVVGIITALILFKWRTGHGLIKMLDFIAIPVPWAAFWIRLGNLMSSEIIGKPTDAPWAFVFSSVDSLPRHPAQLYEAIMYLIIYIITMWLYIKYRTRLHTGFFLGFCLVSIFTFRFFIEFIKENQIRAENIMSINIGQWLSIPCILLGLFFMFVYNKAGTKNDPTTGYLS